MTPEYRASILAFIMVAIAVGFATIAVLGLRRGVLPFRFFPIKRREMPEFFNFYLGVLILMVLCFLAGAVIAWRAHGVVD